VPIIVTIPGLLGLAVLLNPDGTPMILVPESDPRANITLRTFNDVLPLLMGQYLGPGLLGLGVTAMIAGFMSGMAGNVSAFATVWTYDVYKPLLNKNASDRHYLGMGRGCSILGVLISIATAYSLFYFSNILEFLQVLVFFFIVPLFGTVILGMLWKRATPAGGFWGFLAAIIVSMSMWAFVHTFPEGSKPNPTVVIGNNAVVSIVKTADKISQVVVESGQIQTTNVAIPLEAGKEPVTSGQYAAPQTGVAISGIVKDNGGMKPLRVLVPDAVDADTKQHTKFGVEGVSLALKSGVTIRASYVSKKFDAAGFNPAHTKFIARSEKAKPMAVNMYSAFWSLLVCLGVTIGVSLFTRPKSDEELKNLVMGLTEVPDEGPCPWYNNPKLWAAAVFIVLVVVNIIFW
jgi:Na+/proline symporter